jgi:hypothetical protein
MNDRDFLATTDKAGLAVDPATDDVQKLRLRFATLPAATFANARTASGG